MTATTPAGRTQARAITAGELVRPVWRRLRYWIAAVVVLILGGVLIGALSDSPGRPLDPASARQDGSLAIARMLSSDGTRVTRTTSIDRAVVGATSATVVVTSPDDYSERQLRDLHRTGARLVLVQPGVRALRAIAPGVEPVSDSTVSNSPGCADPGAGAAGDVDLPADAVPYDGAGTRCYGGALLLAPDIVVLGSTDMLRNDTLDHRGVAAFDVNAISADRTVGDVVWLLPGADAAGTGPVSIWDLFPTGAYRAFWWLLAVSALLVLWRARRLGGVVSEPLPVIVRSAEVVEGHGRLYLRAGAADRAAAALRQATTARLARRLGLPRGTGATRVAAAVAPGATRSPGEVSALLCGGAPADDAALLRLATELDRLEAAVGDPAGSAGEEE